MEATLTYSDLAQRLGVNEGTLRRKLLEFNRLAEVEGRLQDQVKPEVQFHPGYSKHLFPENALGKIQAALAAVTDRGRGRPRKPSPERTAP